MTGETSSPSSDLRTLASRLAPLLDQVCDHRLHDLVWFKADWQRGGAATATAAYRGNDGEDLPVVVKLPVGERELRWTRILQAPPGEAGVVPRLYASDESIGGYDLGWIVIERFPFGPLGRHWGNDHVARIADAAARFYKAAAPTPVDQPPKREDWSVLVRESQESVKLNRLDRHKEWARALKALRRRLDDIVEEWRARDTNQWLHGDLHLANAMSRISEQEGEVALIDLAEIHAGHWIEDAIYLERQLWARPERLKPHAPVREIAHARKARGLGVDDDYGRLATIRRALLAATAPKFIKSEGHPVFLGACLDRLERSLAELC